MLLVFCHETATTVYSTDGHPLSLHYSLLISVAGSCRRHAGGDAKIADRARGRRRRERARIRRRFRNRRVRAKELVDAGSPHRALILATDHHFGDYLPGGAATVGPDAAHVRKRIVGIAERAVQLEPVDDRHAALPDDFPYVVIAPGTLDDYASAARCGEDKTGAQY